MHCFSAGVCPVFLHEAAVIRGDTVIPDHALCNLCSVLSQRLNERGRKKRKGPIIDDCISV